MAKEVLMEYYKAGGNGSEDEVMPLFDKEVFGEMVKRGYLARTENQGMTVYSLKSGLAPGASDRPVRKPPAVRRKSPAPSVSKAATTREAIVQPPPDDLLLQYIRRRRVTLVTVLEANGFTEEAARDLSEKGEIVIADDGKGHTFCALATDGTGDLKHYPKGALPGLLSCMYVRTQPEAPHLDYETLIAQHDAKVCNWTFR